MDINKLRFYYNFIRTNGVNYCGRIAKDKIKRTILIPKEFKGFPERLHVETSTICNLSCEYCVLKTNMHNKKIMSLNQFNLLKPYFKYISSISLSGLAEPLLAERIPHCVA